MKGENANIKVGTFKLVGKNDKEDVQGEELETGFVTSGEEKRIQKVRWDMRNQ